MKRVEEKSAKRREQQDHEADQHGLRGRPLSQRYDQQDEPQRAEDRVDKRDRPGRELVTQHRCGKDSPPEGGDCEYDNSIDNHVSSLPVGMV